MEIKASKLLTVIESVNGITLSSSEKMVEVTVRVDSVKVSSEMIGVGSYSYYIGDVRVGSGDVSFQYNRVTDAIRQSYEAILTCSDFTDSTLVM